MTTRDVNRYETLKASLANLGPIRRGSVLRRLMRYGPYYEWTRKLEGKTVSVSVTEEQGRLLNQWIANARRLETIVADM